MKTQKNKDDGVPDPEADRAKLEKSIVASIDNLANDLPMVLIQVRTVGAVFAFAPLFSFSLHVMY